MNKSIEYYNNNAQTYYEATHNLKFNHVWDLLLKHLQKGDHILDLGCGSGRDSKEFLRLGFKVTAIDGSKGLCDLANKLIGQEVICKNYFEINDISEYDGIWACASLLHLTNIELKEILKKLIIALKTNGYFYLSFKYGNLERDKNGRHFNDMDENKFNEILNHFQNLELIQYIITEDVIAGRIGEKWFNIVVKKV